MEVSLCSWGQKHLWQNFEEIANYILLSTIFALNISIQVMRWSFLQYAQFAAFEDLLLGVLDVLLPFVDFTWPFLVCSAFPFLSHFLCCSSLWFLYKRYMGLLMPLSSPVAIPSDAPDLVPLFCVCNDCTLTIFVADKLVSNQWVVWEHMHHKDRSSSTFSPDKQDSRW